MTRTTTARPATRTVRTTSARPATRTVVVHGRPSTRTVTTRHRAYTYRTYRVRPYSGVFVYGPRPVHHHHYHTTSAAPVRKSHMPKRQLDRDDSLALGVRAGSYFGGYEGANGYADLGLGLAGRYRPEESVGFELAISRHDQTWTAESERAHTTVAASAELFAFPWTRVSPYVLGGVTYTDRAVQDDIFRNDTVETVSTAAPKFGPHMGLGVEFAIGQSVALDLEARYVGYLNRTDDPTVNGAFQTTAGFMVHF